MTCKRISLLQKNSLFGKWDASSEKQYPKKLSDTISHPSYLMDISRIITVFIHYYAMSIRLIVGLGNPGPEYEQTRHNAGFWLVDNLANQMHSRLVRETRYQALVGKATIAGQEIWLLEPQTYMNRSGISVGMLTHFFKIDPAEILVVHDELDLAPGIVKIKKGGSSGGHNGLKDITAALGTQDYWRLRIGIGHPRNANLQQAVADYVLHRARKDEQRLIDEAIAKSLDVIPSLCQGKFEAAIMQLHTAK